MLSCSTRMKIAGRSIGARGKTNRGSLFDKLSAMKFLTLITCGILFLTLACHDEAVKICESLDINIPGLKAELNQRLRSLHPKPSDEDPIGHHDNLTFFVELLKTDCNLETSIGCYACIKTGPPQSEVILMVDSSGYVIKRVLDISTPESGVMSVVNIHH